MCCQCQRRRRTKNLQERLHRPIKTHHFAPKTGKCPLPMLSSRDSACQYLCASQTQANTSPSVQKHESEHGPVMLALCRLNSILFVWAQREPERLYGSSAALSGRGLPSGPASRTLELGQREHTHLNVAPAGSLSVFLFLREAARSWDASRCARRFVRNDGAVSDSRPA